MSDPAQKTVLYVDDEENDGLLLQLAFQQARIAVPVQLVHDGAEAVSYLAGAGQYADRQRYPLPGVVLLDFKLPKLSGLQVLERVRKTFSPEQLPIVLFSSSEQLTDQARAKELGANAYIVKPTSMEGFVAVATRLAREWLQHDARS